MGGPGRLEVVFAARRSWRASMLLTEWRASAPEPGVATLLDGGVGRGASPGRPLVRSADGFVVRIAGRARMGVLSGIGHEDVQRR